MTYKLLILAHKSKLNMIWWSVQIGMNFRGKYSRSPGVVAATFKRLNNGLSKKERLSAYDKNFNRPTFYMLANVWYAPIQPSYPSQHEHELREAALLFSEDVKRTPYVGFSLFMYMWTQFSIGNLKENSWIIKTLTNARLDPEALIASKKANEMTKCSVKAQLAFAEGDYMEVHEQYAVLKNVDVKYPSLITVAGGGAAIHSRGGQRFSGMLAFMSVVDGDFASALQHLRINFSGFQRKEIMGPMGNSHVESSLTIHTHTLVNLYKHFTDDKKTRTEIKTYILRFRAYIEKNQ